jgi:hypothetical protein
MRPLLFLGALTILALGFAATRLLDREAGLGFLLGALQLGGGLAIAGLFSLRWKWQGIAAAEVLALLGFARGLGNLPALAAYSTDAVSNRRPLLESCVTAICLLLLVATVRMLFAERRRRSLGEES